MSAMNSAADYWAALTTPRRGDLTAQRHPQFHGVFVAIDHIGNRHLLVQVAEDASRGILLRTHGLTAEVTDLQLETEPQGRWADISSTNPSLNDTFTAVADDLATEVADHPQQPMTAVQRTLDKWRRFWGVERRPMSQEQELGLFGELWFLDQWSASLETVRTWMGPLGNRHDFVAPTLSVEVKAAHSGDGSAPHRISSLDQLADPETGQLLLFSLHVIDDAAAGNSLHSLISRLRQHLSDRPDLLLTLEERLAAAGWTPASEQQSPHTLRIIKQGLYRVEQGFPRLTSDAFGGQPPHGVVAIAYSVDIEACSPWLVTANPSDARPHLRALA